MRNKVERIKFENEKQLQHQQAEAKRLKFEAIRKTLISACDDTGCLLKNTHKYAWNRMLCTEVTWEVTEHVLCILRFTEDITNPFVFLRYHAARSAGELLHSV